VDPLVSVNIPVYNGEKFIKESVSSILSQSYQNIELVIVNDGSTDSTSEILNSFKNSNIRVINNNENRGLVFSRNVALDNSNGKYVALLDSDDIAEEGRIKKQVDFLERNPCYVLAGGGYGLIDENGSELHGNVCFSQSSYNISIHLLFANCFCQSSIMMRRDSFIEYQYREGFAPAEDFDLWARLAKAHCLYQMPEKLVKYRVHKSNTSTTHRLLQLSAVSEILKWQLNELDIIPDDKMLFYHSTFLNLTVKYDQSQLIECLRYLGELKRKNRLKKVYINESFEYFVDKNIRNRIRSFFFNEGRRYFSLKTLFQKDLKASRYFSIREIISLLIK
jgi:glycosyltransferase involved in cell wall biosynthesis